MCKIYGEENAFLQQASNITGGVYVRVENTQALLEYLMMAFLPDRYARNYLNLPSQDQVDFRAACFCHKRIVDIGYVCSVCLSSKSWEMLLENMGANKLFLNSLLWMVSSVFYLQVSIWNSISLV